MLIPGKYIGYVQKAAAITKPKKTGYITISEVGQYISISCGSDLKPMLSVQIDRDKLAQYFSDKEELVVNGTVEERVSFTHSIPDSCGFLKSALRGFINESYAYQMKFRAGSLYALSLQHYRTVFPTLTINPRNLIEIRYLLEISNIERIPE